MDDLKWLAKQLRRDLAAAASRSVKMPLEVFLDGLNLLRDITRK